MGTAEKVKEILCEVMPSNESISGLNDYLTTKVPNLHQLAQSTLVQVKKNGSLKWLSNLKEEDQSAVIDLAVRQRRLVTKECRDEENARAQQRKQMLQENVKRVAQEKKLYEEKEKLLQAHLITSSNELLSIKNC